MIDFCFVLNSRKKTEIKAHLMRGENEPAAVAQFSIGHTSSHQPMVAKHIKCMHYTQHTMDGF